MTGDKCDEVMDLYYVLNVMFWCSARSKLNFGDGIKKELRLPRVYKTHERHSRTTVKGLPFLFIWLTLRLTI